MSHSFIENNQDNLFIITDSDVEKLVLPSLPIADLIAERPRFVIPAGEENKNIHSLTRIWEWLSEKEATRKSVILNIGGGMVSDIGGLAAATYMRGIRYANLPTTLLGAVDAAIGGKTAINLGAVKNRVGLFAFPDEVLFFTEPFQTLPPEEMLSGFGEMLKYGLIASPMLYRAMLDPDKFLEDPNLLAAPVRECAAIKNRIVEKDPREGGLRKVLNFGHTAGHALESLALERNIHLPHGIAVAHGLLIELILSHTILGCPSAELYPLAFALKEHFPKFPTQCKDNDHLIRLMRGDKKNTSADKINFTLLENIAMPVIDQIADPEEIATALDIYRDLTL